MGLMRIDKFLAETGAATRSEAKKLARRGEILVNGVPARQTDMKIDPEKDSVSCAGTSVAYAAFEYYLLNKPAGVLSAANDKRAVTVVDLIESRLRRDLFPVGRLDKDTEGLLLITNDGALAHRLLSPKKHVDKTYYVELDHPVSAAELVMLEQGVDIGDEKPTLPCSIYAGEAVSPVPGATYLQTTERLHQNVRGMQTSNREPVPPVPPALCPPLLDGAHLLITIREGRFHQIKRMFAVCGCSVTYLKRLRMGTLLLDPSLEAGAYRPLTEEELSAL